MIWLNSSDPELSLDLPKRLLDTLDNLVQLGELVLWWDGFRTGLFLGILVVLLWTSRR